MWVGVWHVTDVPRPERDGSHRDVSLETSRLHTQKTPPVLLCEADAEGSWTFILPTDQQGATPLVAIRSLVYRSRNQQTQGSYQQSTNRWVTSRWLRHGDYVTMTMSTSYKLSMCTAPAFSPSCFWTQIKVSDASLCDRPPKATGYLFSTATQQWKHHCEHTNK